MAYWSCSSLPAGASWNVNDTSACKCTYNTFSIVKSDIRDPDEKYKIKPMCNKNKIGIVSQITKYTGLFSTNNYPPWIISLDIFQTWSYLPSCTSSGCIIVSSVLVHSFRRKIKGTDRQRDRVIPIYHASNNKYILLKSLPSMPKTMEQKLKNSHFKLRK